MQLVPAVIVNSEDATETAVSDRTLSMLAMFGWVRSTESDVIEAPKTGPLIMRL